MYWSKKRTRRMKALVAQIQRYFWHAICKCTENYYYTFQYHQNWNFKGQMQQNLDNFSFLEKPSWKSQLYQHEAESTLKDVCAHCYCASLLCTLFIRHARATSFWSACTESKTQQNIELMTFALTWCANIFVGCSVTPTFFLADHFLLWFFPLY